MKVLITGSSGFIGEHLVRYLSERYYEIAEVDRLIGKEVDDLTENDIINVDIVIHLAAQTSVWNEDIEGIEHDNIQSFIYIFNLCKKLNKRFIYASSSCSANITSMYGLSKYFDDKYAQIYGWDKCIGLRFHNVYGSNPRPDTLLGCCMTHQLVLYHYGGNRRHFTYIDDVCRAIESSFSLSRGLYNVFNPIENSTEEFVNEVQKYINITVTKTNVIRKYDQYRQEIQSYQNLLDTDYTVIEEGIRKIFNDKLLWQKT